MGLPVVVLRHLLLPSYESVRRETLADFFGSGTVLTLDQPGSAMPAPDETDELVETFAELILRTVG